MWPKEMKLIFQAMLWNVFRLWKEGNKSKHTRIYKCISCINWDTKFRSITTYDCLSLSTAECACVRVCVYVTMYWALKRFKSVQNSLYNNNI